MHIMDLQHFSIMGAEINKLIIVIFALAAVVVGAGIMTADNGSSTTKWTQQRPLSFPEEIYLAEQGDTLVVSKVADSIYIQFK